MGNDQDLRDGRLVFYRDDLEKIDKVLDELVRLSEAKSVLLVDKEGHMITGGGKTPSFDQDTISALVAGSFSATREMARILGEREFSALFHQGKRDNIQLQMVGDRTILTIIFDEGTTLGMIRLYGAEAVEKLEMLFNDIERKRATGGQTEAELQEVAAIGEGFENSAQDTLDAFFDNQ